MPNNLSVTSSGDARKLDAQKNTCKECAKAGRSPKEACPHKGEDNAAGTEETAGKSSEKAETSGSSKPEAGTQKTEQESQPALLKKALSFEYNLDKESGIFKISLHNDPKLTPETRKKLEKDIIDTWVAFRTAHKLEKDPRFDISHPSENMTIIRVPSHLFNAFIQALADKGVIPQEKAKQIQQQHTNSIEQMQKAAPAAPTVGGIRTPFQKLIDPAGTPRLDR